jgi:hypothetical protein
MRRGSLGCRLCHNFQYGEEGFAKFANCFLNSRYLTLSVTAAAIEAYTAAIDPAYNENPMLPANFANTADFITDLKRQLFSLKSTLSELENLELQKAKNEEDNYLDMPLLAFQIF